MEIIFSGVNSASEWVLAVLLACLHCCACKLQLSMLDKSWLCCSLYAC
jgi:hypothetical protein